LTEAVRNHMPRQKLKIETSLETPASDWSVWKFHSISNQSASRNWFPVSILYVFHEQPAPCLRTT
jgi:hypothetical protein